MHISLIFIIIFLLAACTPQSTPTSPSTATPQSSLPTYSIPAVKGDNPTMAPNPSTPSSSGLQSLIEKAKENLAQRLSISSSQIDLMSATEVVWPNSSLGCPQEGMVYADVLTPGYLILLNANNMDYEYHASKGTEVIYCANPTPPVPDAPSDI